MGTYSAGRELGMSSTFCGFLYKGTLWRTSNREPQEYSRNIRTLVGIFLLYSGYILGVPYLGFPIKSLYFSRSTLYTEIRNFACASTSKTIDRDCETKQP